MESMHLNRAFIVMLLVNRVRILALKPPDSSGHHRDDYEPVVEDRKEVQQRVTYRVDDKRSYGRPGNESHFVQRKHPEIDMKPPPPVFPGQPHDCADIQASGVNVSGIYGIYSAGMGNRINVYCDMETYGGGWTVFQRRMDGSVDFFRYWLDYKNGFGSISSEHWLGNEKIHHLSSQKSYELRVDLEDFTRQTRYASYNLFYLGNETENYKLTLGGFFRGTAGDSFKFHTSLPFSTRDRDHSGLDLDCATTFQSGWWFHSCFRCNLNGPYYWNATFDHVPWEGVIWRAWLGAGYSLKRTEMKIRPGPGTTDR